MRAVSIMLFGEVLFDHFSDGSVRLGGAPLNVAWHLQALQLQPLLVSSIGNDDSGLQIQQTLAAHGMNLHALQCHPTLPTGRVDVSLNDEEPSYDINYPSAFDAIAIPAVSAENALLYHGSLALRGDSNQQTLAALRAQQPRRVVLDVNLRTPWWDRTSVLDTVRHASWVKLNDDEFLALFGSSSPAEVVRDYALEGVVITHGAAGATLCQQDHSYFSPAVLANELVDTVGAGDALTAIFIAGLALDWPLETTLDRAQQFASSITRIRGAIPRSPDFYQGLIQSWLGTANGS